MLTPDYDGSRYGRSSVVSFLEVHPKGLITDTKLGWGKLGLWVG